MLKKIPKGYKRATEKRHQTGCLSDIKTLSNDRVKNKQVKVWKGFFYTNYVIPGFYKEWFKCST